MRQISKAAVLYVTLFIVLSMPFGLSLLPQNLNNTEFSIYNTNWNGLSDFRSILTQDHPNVQIKDLLGSANALNRLNESTGQDAGSLVIMGPKVPYDFSEGLAIMLYAAKGGRVLIADDFGSANDILNYFSFLISSLSNTLGSETTTLFGINPSSQLQCTTNRTNPFPIIGIAINNSLLIDTQSFYQSPVQPVFTPPPTQGLSGSTYSTLAPWLKNMIDNSNGVQNVYKVIGNYASIISMKVQYPTQFTNLTNPSMKIDSNTYFGLSSTQKCEFNPTTFKKAWVPFSEFPASITQIQGVKVPEFNISVKLSALYSSQKSFLDSNITAARNVNTIKPSSSEWGNIEFPVAIEFPFGTGTNAGSLTIISDPSIFINKYLSTTPTGSFDPTQFDNRNFASNILNILTGDRPNSVVYFDEGHLDQSLLSPVLYLGTYFRILDFMTMVPFIAPFLPLLVYGFARSLAPKGKHGSALLKTKAENYYGKSYFAYKMRWFLENRHFNRGLELIYRRIRRDLMKRYKMDEWNPEVAVMYLNREYGNFRKNLLPKVLEIENVLNHNVLIEEQRFMDLYLVCQEISNHIKL